MSKRSIPRLKLTASIDFINEARRDENQRKSINLSKSDYHLNSIQALIKTLAL